MLLEKKFGMSLDKFKQSGTKWDKFWMQLQTDFDPSFEGVTIQNQGCLNEHLAWLYKFRPISDKFKQVWTSLNQI